MENICLDTDILVDFLRNKKEAVAFIESLGPENTLSTTYINLFELYYGAMRSSFRQHNLESLEKLQHRLTLLNLSSSSVKEAGRILAELEKSGNPIDFRDLLIGTIALVHNFSLKTNNTKHFSRIKGLQLI
ncbi:MAG TPA: type II toxin-antitoxin system VapC family toxin [Candidatus Nanoarchaeia archaeon]|nr:type II toxin-antitoxin system VapC family toxin [Candidatus Nanoarchaeia archaeon]